MNRRAPHRYLAYIALCAALLAVAAAAAPTSVADTCAPDPPAALDETEARALASTGEIAPASTKQRTPRYLEDIARRYALTDDERARLLRNGFVVLAKVDEDSYGAAFHDVYRSELPLYVGVDAMLDALFVENDRALGEIERARIAPLYASTLRAMHEALPKLRADLPPDVARDVDLWLTVARSLTEDRAVPAVDRAVDADAAVLVDKVKRAEALEVVDVFGRPRSIDFTQMTPRGRYADAALAPYFRGAMWGARVEWNLVSRASRSSTPGDVVDPSETPREALDALALASLMERGHAREGVDALDAAWAAMAGRREDVSLPQLIALRDRVGIRSLRDPRAFEMLKAAIGDGYRRTTRVHPMPDGSDPLPVISTLLGPRITPDASAVMPLVHPRVVDRHHVGGADFAYVLGVDRAKDLLAPELARFPDLGGGLDAARAVVRAGTGGAGEPDLYAPWLTTLRALADKPGAVHPRFMDTAAFQDLRVNSAVVGYAQLRHNNVLVAGQPYDEGGCAIPDAFVEPVPSFWAALLAYDERALALFHVLDPDDASGAAVVIGRQRDTARLLHSIAVHESEGRGLSDDEERFLAMVAEMSPGGTGGPPQYSGWWFNLFEQPEDGLASSALLADVFTSGYDGTIEYLGATGARMAVFLVDVDGAPRAMVGPVARGFDLTGPLTNRKSDADVATLEDLGDAWAKSYTAPVVDAPNLQVDVDGDGVIHTSAPASIRAVTIELLDHHMRPLARATHDVAKGEHVFRVPKRAADAPAEGIHVHRGRFDGWADLAWFGGGGTFGNPR